MLHGQNLNCTTYNFNTHQRSYNSSLCLLSLCHTAGERIFDAALWNQKVAEKGLRNLVRKVRR